MAVQGNLITYWSWETYSGTGNTTDWTGWEETRTDGAGTATVEADTTYERFGAACCHLQGDAADTVASVTSSDFISVTNTYHYILRFSHYRASGGNYLTVTVKQYDSEESDLSDDITVTPSGSAAWAVSNTVIHATGDGGNDFHADCTQVKIICKVTGGAASWYIDGIVFAHHEGTVSDHAFGSKVFLNGYELCELTSITGPNLSTETIDVTSHDSDNTYREYISGPFEGGEISIEGLIRVDDTTGQVAMITDAGDGSSNTYHVIWPAAYAEVLFTGYTTGYTQVAAYDDALRFSATLKITGKPTYTVADYS